MTVRLLLCILLGALPLITSAVHARSVYRWVDENGRVHYDDINNRGQRMTREYMSKRVVQEQPEWAGIIPGELVAEVQQRCNSAKERLKSYGAAPEIYSRDPSGNVYRLSSTQSRLMLAEIQGEVDYYCGDKAPRRVFADRQAEAEALREQRAQARKP